MSFLNKAKGLLVKNKDKVQQGIEKAGEIAKKKADPKHADKIDKATQKAQDGVKKL